GPHVALDRPDRPVDVGHRLALGDLADEHLAVLGEGDHGRSGPGALRVGDDGGFTAFEDRDDGVCRPQVDTYRTSHEYVLIVKVESVRLNVTDRPTFVNRLEPIRLNSLACGSIPRPPRTET